MYVGSIVKLSIINSLNSKQNNIGMETESKTRTATQTHSTEWSEAMTKDIAVTKADFSLQLHVAALYNKLRR